MASSRTLTSRLFKVAEPNPYNATHVKRTITYEPKTRDLYGNTRDAGYFMTMQVAEYRLEDGYRVETTRDLIGSMSTYDLVQLEFSPRFNQKRADEIVEKYADVGFIERYCERHNLRLASDPMDSEFNNPSYNTEYRQGGYVRYANKDTKEKTYDMLYFGQTIKNVKHKDLPRQMQRNNLKVREGEYMGGILLTRTRDKKFKVYDPSFGVNGLDNYSATEYGIMNYFSKNHIGPDNYDRFVDLLWNTGIEDAFMFNGDRILIGCKCDDYSFEPGNKSLAQLHVPRPTKTKKPQPKKMTSSKIVRKATSKKPAAKKKAKK